MAIYQVEKIRNFLPYSQTNTKAQQKERKMKKNEMKKT